MIIATILVGCESVREEVDATSTLATANSTPSLTAPRLQGTPTESPTPSAIPSQIPSPTPEVRLPDEILFEQESSACELPCWHDIRIGESNLATVQATLDAVFHINKDLFAELSYQQEDPHRDVPGLLSVSWGKTLSRSPLQRFAQEIWITEEDQLLQGMVFHLQYEPYTSAITLERIVHALGKPDFLFANVGKEGNDGSIAVMPVYAQGMAFLIVTYVPIISRENNTTTIEYCLDSPRPRSADSTEYLSIYTSAYLVPPIRDINSLDPLQEFLIGFEIEDRQLMPFENTFGINIEQLYTRMQGGGTVCLQGQRTFSEDTGIGS